MTQWLRNTLIYRYSVCFYGEPNYSSSLEHHQFPGTQETPTLYSKTGGWQLEERHAKACLSSLLRELSITVWSSSNNCSTPRKKNITAESSAICPSLLCSPVYTPTCNSSTPLHIEGNAGSQLPVLLLENYLPGSQKRRLKDLSLDYTLSISFHQGSLYKVEVVWATSLKLPKVHKLLPECRQNRSLFCCSGFFSSSCKRSLTTKWVKIKISHSQDTQNSTADTSEQGKGSSFLCTQKWLTTLNCSFFRPHNTDLVFFSCRQKFP